MRPSTTSPPLAPIETKTGQDQLSSNDEKLDDTCLEAQSSNCAPASHLNKSTSDELPAPEDTSGYLQGWRLTVTIILNLLIFFIVNMDMSVVNTSLIIITSDIGGFDKANWIFASYLLGYVSCIVFISKLSDIFGRKPLYLGSILLFTIFSGACGAAQTISQLIVFRALQGVAGGGSFTMSGIMFRQMVSDKGFANAMSYGGIVFVLSVVVGPIIGGAFSQNVTWRWIFLLNVPIGVFAMAMGSCSIPNGYPNHNTPGKRQEKRISELVARIDSIGCVLLLSAIVTCTAAFQEANSDFSWNSAFFITLVTISIVLWVLLLVWQYHLSNSTSIKEPILPWRFISRREILASLLGITFLGGNFAVPGVLLLQRYQLINGLGAINAGLRFLPFGVSANIGGIVNSQVFNTFKIPLLYTVIFGATLQTLGFGLLATTSASRKFPHVLYGFEVIAGFGCGWTYTAYVCFVQYAADKRDQAIGFGVATQSRAMGSVMGVAIATAIYNSRALPELKSMGISNPNNITNTKINSDFRPEPQRHLVNALSAGYNDAMWLVCAFGAAQIGTAFMMWKKNQITAPQKTSEKN